MKLQGNNFSQEGFYFRYTCAKKCVHIEVRKRLRRIEREREIKWKAIRSLGLQTCVNVGGG